MKVDNKNNIQKLIDTVSTLEGESEITVIRIEPLDLPADIVWQISGLHHITPKDFYVYVLETKNKMYVNKAVPEKDIEKMIEVMTFPGRYILEDDTKTGQFMKYVYDTYGFAAYDTICNYHEWRMKQQDERRAKEKVQSVIPSIEKMIKAGMIDEYMIYEAYKAGNDRKEHTSKNICNFSTVYSYCLGYLIGAGALKEEYHPDDSENVIDYYYEITEMLERIDMQEMPGIYGYLKKMYFLEEKQKGDAVYLKKIFKVLSSVNNVWVLDQIYQFAVNMTKEEKGGTE